MNFKKIALAGLAGTMVMSVAAFAEGGQPIKEVSYNITATGGDAAYTMQFSDWSSYTFTVKEGTADYAVDFEADEEAGFTNLGYIMSATDPANVKIEDGITVVVNTITVNGYQFDLSSNVLQSGKNDDGGERNGELNIWWGDNGADIASVDGKATIKFSSSALELIVAEESTATADVAPIAYLAALVAVAGIAMVASKKRA
ncbi:MAG: hypothetical protein II688_07785 [Lachnospiraceae bacterium]|nr:hypothetical protein [Lachnospiraceae bacterium]